MARCENVYQGPSYPEFHGTRCQAEGSHPETRHYTYVALTSTGALTWWDEEQKKARRAARAEGH